MTKIQINESLIKSERYGFIGEAINMVFKKYDIPLNADCYLEFDERHRKNNIIIDIDDGKDNVKRIKDRERHQSVANSVADC